MKAYRFGDCTTFYNLLIEEDNGETRVSSVGFNRIEEYVAEEVICKGGITRLSFAGGSSLPYKNADGTLNNKFTLVYDSNK